MPAGNTCLTPRTYLPRNREALRTRRPPAARHTVGGKVSHRPFGSNRSFLPNGPWCVPTRVGSGVAWAGPPGWLGASDASSRLEREFYVQAGPRSARAVEKDLAAERLHPVLQPARPVPWAKSAPPTPSSRIRTRRGRESAGSSPGRPEHLTQAAGTQAPPQRRCAPPLPRDGLGSPGSRGLFLSLKLQRSCHCPAPRLSRAIW